MNIMISIRKSEERGHANHGWLNAKHAFSFAEYHDPAHMGYSVLRVLNEDVIEGGKGFGMHPHRDMEIVTYLLAGELRHTDNMGNTSVIGVGDVQRMTAGTGVLHSEFNASMNDPVHLFQIWIVPAKYKLQPSYEERHFTDVQKKNRWCLIVSPNGDESSIMIHQDARIYTSLLDGGHQLLMPVVEQRSNYLQIAKGKVRIKNIELNVGDAVKIDDEAGIEINAESDAALLWFDLPRI